jgi:hypothetical protein
LDACNEVGQLATLHAIKRFDTDGSPIQVGGVKFTSKGTTPKFYETPYGAVEIHRHVYQTSKGGKRNLNAPAVCRDLEENHHSAGFKLFDKSQMRALSGFFCML